MTKLHKTMTSNPLDDDTYDDDGFEAEMAEADKMIAENPNDAAGYVKRGRLHLDDGYYAAAMPDLNKAIELDPDNAEAFAARGLANSTYYWDDGDQAHCDFDTAMAILSRKYPVRLQSRDNDVKSPSELATVIEQATKDICNKGSVYDALIRRARAYGEFGEPVKMEKDLAKAILRDPTNPEAYLARAELHDTEEDDLRVKADVETAYRLDPTRPEGYTRLANLYYHAGEDLNDLALAAADKALGIRADFAPAHFVRGKILRKMDQLPEAIKEFRETVTLDPTHAYGHLHLAECLESAGHIPEAIVEYESFIAEADKVSVLHIIDTIKHVEELNSGKD